MKKLFFAALIATSVATMSFATDANKINVKIKNTFRAEYYDAQNVTWLLREDFAKATFQQDGKTIEAFYNLNGESIGTSRHISIDELPTNAKRVFAKKYADYTVKEAIQFESAAENAYYISAENDQESVVLKVDQYNSVTPFKRERKN